MIIMLINDGKPADYIRALDRRRFEDVLGVFYERFYAGQRFGILEYKDKDDISWRLGVDTDIMQKSFQYSRRNPPMTKQVTIRIIIHQEEQGKKQEELSMEFFKCLFPVFKDWELTGPDASQAADLVRYEWAYRFIGK